MCISAADKLFTDITPIKLPNVLVRKLVLFNDFEFVVVSIISSCFKITAQKYYATY